jgi:hypothetical protein
MEAQFKVDTTFWFVVMCNASGTAGKEAVTGQPSTVHGLSATE